jgi:hypothetical protein
MPKDDIEPLRFTSGHLVHGGKNLRIKSTGEPLSSICSHQWIGPNDPPLSRTPYSPVIGPARPEMKRGMTYQCQRCGETIKA